jgi:ABC-type transport system involved in cytochrome bd biosynthesis fused ATPase/permease subunit
MKIAGFLLLLSGWLLVLAAVMLLAVPASRLCFVLAGVGVEILGLFLVFRAHSSLAGERH